MRHFFCDSLKRFLMVFVATLAFVAPTFAATLPAGYTELEYLESTGTQYIDTGVSGFNTGEWEVYAKWMITTQTQPTNYANVFSVYRGEDYNSYRVINKLQDSTSYYVSGNSKAGGGSTLVENIAINQIHEATARNGSVTIDGVVYNTPTQGSTLPASSTMGIFAKGDGNGKIQARIYSAWATKDGVMQYNLVPAKYVSGNTTTYGMYDTVRDTFLTNAGTGTFTAGPEVLNPCRNLFDGEYISVSDGGKAENKNRFYVTPGKKYTVSWNSSTGINALNLYAYNSAGQRLYSWDTSAGSSVYFSNGKNAWWNGDTFTVPENVSYLFFNTFGGTSSSVQALFASSLQIEEGEEVTSYVSYCAKPIKIATTKYTEDAFAGLVATLNSAIDKVTNIVDDTVQQATEIGVLAETKQDRPDTDCPAGRKCLLIMGADNKPHWYLIQE